MTPRRPKPEPDADRHGSITAGQALEGASTATPPASRGSSALLAPLRAVTPLAPEREAALWAQFEASTLHPRPRSWLPVWGGLALAGAAVAAVLLLRPEPVPTPAPVGSLPAAVPAALSLVGTSLVPGHFVLPSGAALEVDPPRSAAGGPDVTVAEARSDATRLVLTRGRVTSSVPKLGPRAYYQVETPEARVTVHGTRFTVERAGEQTTIAVTEGLVSVDPEGWRPAFLLRPGESRGVMPCTPDPASAAAGQGDQRCVADGLLALAAGSPDPLSRDNHRLRAGRILTTLAPREAAAHWQQMLLDAPTGVHAEEVAYRLALSLHRAGDARAARTAAESFRQQFPKSAWREATKEF